jgi:hypothetical protein
MLICATILVVSGCGSRLVPVQGQLVWSDGTPARELSGGEIEAVREGSKFGSRAAIGSEGRFQLGTFDHGDGAEPGLLKVVVIPPGGIPLPEAKPPIIHPRFFRFETSGLEIAAERGMPSPITLTVERNPARKR